MKNLLLIISILFLSCNVVKINGRKAIVTKHCYKWHTIVSFKNCAITKWNPYTTEIETVEVCDSAIYDTIFKNN